LKVTSKSDYQHQIYCVTYGDYRNVISAIYEERLSFLLRLQFMAVFQLHF